MAKKFLGMSLGGDNKVDREDRKNAERVQDYLNKFKLDSREISVKTPKKVDAAAQTWQGYSWVREATTTTKERSMRYHDYREMCKVPELNLGLNIYADNSTQQNAVNNVIEIQSNNNKIVEILSNLFFETLDINSNIWSYSRNMCKLGDEFLEVCVDDKEKPRHILSLERFTNPNKLDRIEDEGNLQNFTYKESEDEETNRAGGGNSFAKQETEMKVFQPWQVIHFRIDEEDFAPMGKSIFESGRRTWKQLSLMEDAMLIYRISRAPERRIFYIDVGNLSTKDANLFIEQQKRKFRKKSYINPSTGEIDEKANALSVDEDFFIAVRENSQGTRIDTLPGGTSLGEVDDVKYFRDRILKTMGIPPAYMGGAEGGGGFDYKAFLSQQDIQFARIIERIQKFIVKGLEKIAIIELALNKIDEDELKNFKIKLTPPSNVDQLMEIEIKNQQFALISTMKGVMGVGEGTPFLPDEWIYENILGMNPHEVNKIKLQNQMQAQLMANQAAMGGGGAGGGAMGGGDTGGAAPGMAGGPGGMAPEAPPEQGGEEGGETEPSLEVASNTIEFDGSKWLFENAKDAKKLIEYVSLYEKVHKDNKEYVTNEYRNGVTRMAIEGEFRGLMKVSYSKNGKKTLTENLKINKKIITHEDPIQKLEGGK